MSLRVTFPKPKTWTNQHVERRTAFAQRVQKVREHLYELMKGQQQSDPLNLAARAWAVLLSASGDKSDRQIASMTGLSASCVRRVVRRFELYGLNGLTDPAPRPTRPVAITDQVA